VTLTEALRTGRLTEFIAQEQARGIGPADGCRLDAMAREAVATPVTHKQLEDQTSRSQRADGSTGKRTR
jgi:hypothetical protein